MPKDYTVIYKILRTLQKWRGRRDIGLKGVITMQKENSRPTIPEERMSELIAKAGEFLGEDVRYAYLIASILDETGTTPRELMELIERSCTKGE